MSAKEIKMLRLRLEMSQKEFAETIGYETEGAVSLIERGLREPSGPVLRRLRELAESATAAK